MGLQALLSGCGRAPLQEIVRARSGLRATAALSTRCLFSFSCAGCTVLRDLS